MESSLHLALLTAGIISTLHLFVYYTLCNILVQGICEGSKQKAKELLPMYKTEKIAVTTMYILGIVLIIATFIWNTKDSNMLFVLISVLMDIAYCLYMQSKLHGVIEEHLLKQMEMLFRKIE